MTTTRRRYQGPYQPPSSPFACLGPLKERLARAQRQDEERVVACYRADLARKALPRPSPAQPPPAAAVKATFRHHPRNHSMYVINGNEQANLAQLVEAMPPAGGMAAYLADMDRS